MWRIIVAAILVVCAIVYACYAFIPPPPLLCGVGDGPPITSTRIKLNGGRHLSYRETGAARKTATYKIVVAHGFGSSKFMEFAISDKTLRKFGICLVFFDRAGYGESDPHSSRTVKSEAYDIQELADSLDLGQRFYVMGVSLGGYSAYSCLRYIPNRLAGVVLVAPFMNFWWEKVPQEILRSAFELMPNGDRWTFRVAHHAPSMLYWWSNQIIFPAKNLHDSDRALASDKDLAVGRRKPKQPKSNNLQQGDHESLHRDMIAGFGKWEFDPTELENPFVEFNGSVYMWQGVEDRIIPREVSEYISKALPWIKYHEVPGYGHLLNAERTVCEKIIKKLLFE